MNILILILMNLFKGYFL